MSSEKKQKIALIIVAVVCSLTMLLGILYLVIGSVFYGMALDPDNTMLFGNTTMGDEAMGGEGQVPFEDRSEWFDAVNKTDAFINSNDNLKLHAQEIKHQQQSDNWVIMVHGYRGESSNNASFAYRYNEKGFNVLLPDLRGHGASEGNYIGMGWHDRLDMLLWIDYIVKQNPNAQIALHGISMGAATVMMTTGEKLPKNVKVAVEDCGYSSVYDQFAHVLTETMKLPDAFIMGAANIFVQSKAGYSLKEASSVNQLYNSDTPTLFIHGDKDDFVPYYMLDICYNALNGIKRKFVVEGALHGQASAVNPTGYWAEVFKFVSRFIDNVDAR